MTRTAVVETVSQLDNAVRSFYLDAKRRIAAGIAVVFELRETKGTRLQEQKYHAMIGDIAGQVKLHDKKLDRESWKRLLVDAFKHDTKDDPDLAEAWRKLGQYRVLPALNHDGFVVVGEQTRRFPKALRSAFIEWLYAFGSEHDVAWGEAANDPLIDPDTGEVHASA